MILRILFPHLSIVTTPFEKVVFHANRSHTRIYLDVVLESQDIERRALFSLRNVQAAKYTPYVLTYGEESVFEGEPPKNRRVVLEELQSPLVAALHAAERRAMEPLSTDLRHFIFPGNDGRWEFLAGSCKEPRYLEDHPPRRSIVVS